MARSTRQSKILELISTYEIETQDDLVSKLRASNFDITQATISRDIKELGLIKILSAESGKYKYAIVDNGAQAVSNKYISIFKESVISIKPINNCVIIKCIKGVASAICGLIDKLNLDNLVGAVFGDDTVMVIMPSDEDAYNASKSLADIIN